MIVTEQRFHDAFAANVSKCDVIHLVMQGEMSADSLEQNTIPVD